MPTECIPPKYRFQGSDRREVVAQFDGGKITSDGGGLLLSETARRTGVMRRFAKCFWDERDMRRVEHSVEELLGQRVYGLALGYEDLNDHDELREDHGLAVVVGKADPTGAKRYSRHDRGKPLAGKSTLDRMELSADRRNSYQKIGVDGEAVDRFLVGTYLRSLKRKPRKIVLDVDATDDPLHGQQEGRFFHGYYKCYCYFPLYIFTDDGYPLCARLRSANIDGSAGTVEEVSRIVGQIRERYPKVQIVLRGDSGFAREELMAWCEANKVQYVFGFAQNPRVRRRIADELDEAKAQYEASGKASRVFADFQYKTRTSWSRERRVVAKAEHLSKGSNPRFVVTSFTAQAYGKKKLYEQVYCARGEMENRIKEQQLCLFADRTSSSKMKTNQLRLWLSTVAYLVLHQLRNLGLKGTRLARAQCDTIRLKLLKIGAQVKISVRRIVISLASGYPYEGVFAQAYRNLLRAGPVLV